MKPQIPNSDLSDEAIPLKSIHLFFERDLRTLTQITITAENVPENTWDEVGRVVHHGRQNGGGDQKKPIQFDPRTTASFWAFVAAVLKAGLLKMPVGSDLLDNRTTKTIYSIKSYEGWGEQLLVFPTKRFALHALFSLPWEKRGILKQAFELAVFESGALIHNYHPALEVALKRYGALAPRPKRNFTTELNPDQYVNREEVEPAIRERLASARGISDGRPIIWLYGDEGSGRSTTLRYTLEEEMNSLPFEGFVWVTINTEETAVITFMKCLHSVFPKAIDPIEESNLPKAFAYLWSHPALVVIEAVDRADRSELHFLLRNLLTYKGNNVIVIALKPPDDSIASRTFPIKVPPLNDQELKRYLQLVCARINGAAVEMGDDQRKRLIRMTASNPHKINVVVAALRSGLSFKDVQKAYQREFLPHVFRYVKEKEQNCLLALTFYPHGAYVDELAYLTEMADTEVWSSLKPLFGIVDQRIDLSEGTRYILSSIGNSYPLRKTFGHDERLLMLRRRWYDFFVAGTKEIGFCWDDLGKFAFLDLKGRPETIQYVLKQALNERRYDIAVQIAKKCAYWQYVRGYRLEKGSPVVAWADAAFSLRDMEEYFSALSFTLNIRSKQALHFKGILDIVDTLADELNELLRSVSPPEQEMMRYYHALALRELAKENLEPALTLWRKSMSLNGGARERSAARRWKARCLIKMHRHNEARQLLEEELDEARDFVRPSIMCELQIGEIDLKAGNLRIVKQRLMRIASNVDKTNDPSLTADYQYLLGHCLLGEEDSQAIRSLEEARSLYTGLGMDDRVRELETLIKSHSLQS